MSKTALLSIDVQNAMLEDNPYSKEAFLLNLQALLAFARKSGAEVIHIQHDGGAGDVLEYGTPGGEIATEVAPAEGETVIVKRKNSAFKETGLHAYLQSKAIDTLIMAGMQTEYCVDATCKSAFDLDYAVIIPKSCTTTYDNAYFSGGALISFYENEIWDGRFAQVIPVEDIQAWLEGLAATAQNS